MSCDRLSSKIDEVSDAIDEKIKNVITGDTGFSKVISDVSTKLSNTIDNRLEKLCTDITISADGRFKDLESGVSDIGSKIDELSNSISNEISARVEADAALSETIAKNDSKVNDFISNDFAAHI